MWSSRILVTRLFAIVHHPPYVPKLVYSFYIVVFRSLPADESMNSQQGSVGSFQGQPRPSRSGVLPNSQKGCPRCPPLVVAHDSRRCFEGLPIQGSAAPRTVRNLLGVGLASVIVVEEHPFVLPTYPPELPPEISPSRARTHQTSHQSSCTNMCVDSNLHNKICPGLW